MNSDTFPAASESSSPDLTAVSLRSEAILALGRRIVEALKACERVDLLAAWMAHYVAETIQAVEDSTPEERSRRSKECADAILALWDHRNRLPTGMRPFEDLEPVFVALRSLDPRDNGPRYFCTARTGAKGDDPEPDSAKWLAAADGLDLTARILIRYCLVQAAQTAVDKTRDWVALAEAAGIQSAPEFPVIRILLDEAELTGANELSDSQRKLLEDRLTRLQSFVVMAEALVTDLRAQLGSVATPPILLDSSPTNAPETV